MIRNNFHYILNANLYKKYVNEYFIKTQYITENINKYFWCNIVRAVAPVSGRNYVIYLQNIGLQVFNSI